ncbi:MAG: hypothetical protein NW226_22820 [Microscillaceae bacterium]|nr:hypothetical protein [Microscillaceae bacterium]
MLHKIIGLLVWGCVYVNPQIYFVTKVQGLIIQADTQKTLKTGSQISDTDRLIFKSEDARVYAVNAYGELYKSKTIKTNEIQQVIKVMLPSKGQAATKNFSLSGKKQLQQFWAANDTLNLDQEGFIAKPFAVFLPLHYKVIAKDYKPTSNKYFFLKYTLKGQVHTQVIDYKGDTLVLNKLLFQENGLFAKENASGEVQIFFGNIDGEAVFLSNFKPVFVDDAQIQKEISLLLKYRNTSKSAQEWVNYDLIPYLQEVYGHIYEPNLKQWLREKLNFVY